METLILPLDLALIRWSVKCANWKELAAGHAPVLGAFLAGWYCRCIGASKPENIEQFKDSFNIGWREADAQINIESRKNNDKKNQMPKM